MNEQKQLALAGEDDGTASLLSQAIEKGLGVEALERLVALHERASDRVAAQEFAAALAAFQQECPPIRKTKAGPVLSGSGTKSAYNFAPLDEIANTIRPFLAKHGLSYNWNSEVGENAITVTCVLRHANGHRETAAFTCPTTSRAGMSDQQKVASALTFGRRQSLVQILGLSTTDDDTDAAELGEQAAERVTGKQAADLEALLAELDGKSKGTRARFLAAFGIKDAAELPSFKYAGAVAQLEARR